MTLRASTGLRNAILEKNCFKGLFNEGAIYMYSGSQPSSPDTGATGTLLVKITKASVVHVAGTKSTRQSDFVKVSNAGGAADVFTVLINGRSYAHTAILGDTTSSIAGALAELINEDEEVMAIPATNTTEKGVFVSARFAGDAYSIQVSFSGTSGVISTSAQVANSRYNGLHFLSASGGIIGKESGNAWSGSAIIAGTLGWFRLSEYTDTPTDTSTTAIRLDGSIGTSGADCIMDTSVRANQTVTLDEANFTFPIY